MSDIGAAIHAVHHLDEARVAAYNAAAAYAKEQNPVTEEAVAVALSALENWAVKFGQATAPDPLGVVAEEPEWEYRAVAWELDTENVYDSTRPAPSAGEAIDIAAAQRLLDSNADMPALVIGVQRRRKAGPWVPVKQEGAEQ